MLGKVWSGMGFRSLLFAPASDQGKMLKALASEADGVILDLEDAVAPSEKERARGNLVTLLAEKQAKTVLVRINSLNSQWALQDLLAITPLNLDGVVLPKTESAEDVGKVLWIWDQLSGDTQRAQLGLIYPMIESANGVEEVVRIAKSSSRVGQLLFGSLDYLVNLEIRYPADPLTLIYARSRLVSASATAGLEGPLDGVYPPIKDEEGLALEALTAKKLGFKGKMLIHPAQIKRVNEIFTPDEEEIAEASEMLQIYQQAQAAGKGAIQWQGKMLDEPALKWAQRILKLR